MVLWEITLGTAYFLGLKRTYRLALKIQRRLISPKHPKIRQFVQRRTRSVFDVALRVHRNIQERDIEVGRNLGNWILRWLDRMKPSAQIRGPPPGKPHSDANSSMNMTKQMTNTSNVKPGNTQSRRESDKHFFTSTANILPKPFPAIAMMMKPAKPARTTTPYRHFCISSPEVLRLNYTRNWSKGVLRKDIMQWMNQN
ncbi:envelope glycoprotein [Quillaja saponaria]|uniref:Envelope glycoprotein n=1 Tax=Quillaja saponaria TaxID=32244 RepID=A0AAD7PFX4_QUISA|nr:envelope glycoprotein [Quillaja saponaria]